MKFILRLFKIIIIGAGPAGSTAAGYLAKAGLDVLVIEQEQFPRAHVGEALVPASTRVFQELGFVSVMENHGFLKKYGAAWTSSESATIFSHDWEGLDEDLNIHVRFDEGGIQHNEENYTYHVDRARFDHLLVEHAKGLGANVLFKTKVTGAERINGGYAVSMKSSSETQTIPCQMLIDASGRHTKMGTFKGWKEKDPVFNQIAVHTWYKDYPRTKQENGHTVIHFLNDRNAWIWQIPIDSTTTSFGIVMQHETYVKQGKDPEQVWEKMMAQRPDIYQKLQGSKRLRPLKIEGDYSYAMSQITDDHLLLIGDAARFVDPIFSSGVSIAMNSARFASKSIIAAFASGDFSRKQFEEYEQKISRGCKNWYEFITLYYELNVMFTYFLGRTEYRLDVLEFLQGEVYDEDNPALLQAMRTFVEEVRKNPKHPVYPYLGSLTADTLKKRQF